MRAAQSAPSCRRRRCRRRRCRRRVGCGGSPPAGVKGAKADALRLQVTSYKLQVTSYKLQATSYKLQTTCYKLQATIYKLEATSYKLQVTSYNLQVTSYKLQATCYMLQVTSYKLQATSYRRDGAVALRREDEAGCRRLGGQAALRAVAVHLLRLRARHDRRLDHAARPSL